jgi:hypothetical protein
MLSFNFAVGFIFIYVAGLVYLITLPAVRIVLHSIVARVVKLIWKCYGRKKCGPILGTLERFVWENFGKPQQILGQDKYGLQNRDPEVPNTGIQDIFFRY